MNHDEISLLQFLKQNLKFLFHNRIVFILIAIMFFFLDVYCLKSVVPKDYCVIINISYDSIPEPFIKLSWEKDTNAIYFICKKLKNDKEWTYLDKLYGNDVSYTDYDIEIGIAYEYGVKKFSIPNEGYGYVYAGINCPLTEKRDKCLLLIDNTIAEELKDELEIFKNDIRGDGWTLVSKEVPRTEVFDSLSVETIRNLIIEEFETEPYKLKSVILFGRIAVPYSGEYAIDGHAPQHYGAWAADVYYSVLNNRWSDSLDSTVVADRIDNHNIPWDGKLDQTVIPDSAKLQLGRIDFFKLTDYTESEVELYRNYLSKNHKYRHNIVPPVRKGIIEDSLRIYSGTAFSANAWAEFSNLLGADNVSEGKYLTTLQNSNYIFSYACYSGGYNSVYRIIYSDQFANKNLKGVFTGFFGSWMADWDVDKNLLRSAIASKETMLCSFWPGRPFWHLHHMGLGETIGYSTYVTMNNRATYLSVADDGTRQIHIALMGDPTLRLHYFDPPKKLKLDTTYAIGTWNYIKFSWDKDENVLGYMLYRYLEDINSIQKLNINLYTATSFIDSSVIKGKNIYLVKAVRLEKSNTGTYYNSSQASYLTVDYPSGVNDANKEEEFEIIPNPAENHTIIKHNLVGSLPFKIRIFNLLGEDCTEKVIQTSYNDYIRLDLSALPKGSYYIKADTPYSKYSKLLQVW